MHSILNKNVKEKVNLNKQLYRKLKHFHRANDVNLVRTFMNEEIIHGNVHRLDSKRDHINL